MNYKHLQTVITTVVYIMHQPNFQCNRAQLYWFIFVSIFYINSSSMLLTHVKDLPSNKRPTRHKVIHYKAQFGISRKVYKDHR